MPAIVFNAGDYYPHQGWQFSRLGAQNLEWGIKVHISAQPGSAQRLADCLLPSLARAGVFHKFRPHTDNLEAGATDNQARKFIAVYPQTADQMEFWCERANSLIGRSGLPLGAGSLCHPIRGDVRWGLTGYVFVRYGNFVREHVDDRRGSVSPKLIDYLKRGVNVLVRRPA